MLILAIESSCDETACAIVKDGKDVLSNVVSSQIETHKEFGGVFPEVASRLHVQNINFVIKEAVEKAEIDFKELDAIAVTQGPGLIGSLHIGVMAAKTLAWSLDLPLIPVHHLAGHIYANKLNGNLKFPLLALIISGGHTELVYMKSDYNFEVMGETQDDAIGEAFDKVARQMGLSYPGGPIIDELAQKGHKRYQFPTVKIDNPLNFSFSGLKSAVRQLMLREKRNNRDIVIEDLAFGFQKSAVDELMKRVHLALKKVEVQTLVLGGGVAANSQVRQEFADLKERYPEINILVPPLWACMDQAAMIGLAAETAYNHGHVGDCDLSAKSNIELPSY